MIIRPAERADLAHIEAMWKEWWALAPVPHREFESVLHEQRMVLNSVISRELKGAALYSPEGGVLLWVSHGDGALHGRGVYVEPATRRRGLGNALLEAGFKRAREMGFERIYVSPYYEGVTSRQWLAQAGFEPVQVVMGKEL